MSRGEPSAPRMSPDSHFDNLAIKMIRPENASTGRQKCLPLRESPVHLHLGSCRISSKILQLSRSRFNQTQVKGNKYEVQRSVDRGLDARSGSGAGAGSVSLIVENAPQDRKGNVPLRATRSARRE